MNNANGGDLFIVDNNVPDWTGLEYLRQWSDLAESLDDAIRSTMRTPTRT
ncbi:MAG: hypothetical protein OXI96_04025 [Acidimicrobiaceae bacterium]|nr:hypothetical protein [Acidimicrobiaceae bacterium]